MCRRRNPPLPLYVVGSRILYEITPPDGIAFTSLGLVTRVRRLRSTCLIYYTIQLDALHTNTFVEREDTLRTSLIHT